MIKCQLLAIILLNKLMTIILRANWQIPYNPNMAHYLLCEKIRTANSFVFFIFLLNEFIYFFLEQICGVWIIFI